jgi:3'-5' exonuclease
MNIYFDIETIPAQDLAAIELIKADIEKQKLSVKAPGNYKDQEKIDAYIKAEVEKLDAEFDATYRKTSFDGGLGEICCIGYAIDDNAPVSIYGASESLILLQFYQEIMAQYNPSSQTRPKFIGHNIVNFDLRFLFQRSVMNNVKPPMMIPFSAKPWDESIFDTMTAWAGHGNRVRLDKLCKIFNIPQKGSEIGEEIDGSMVWDFYQAGRIQDIAKYCAGDVERTRQAYKRMTFQ